jgi:hypothetical protein
MRVTPSLPLWGRQPKGSAPLTPKKFFINLRRFIAIGVRSEPRRGIIRDMQRTLKSDNFLHTKQIKTAAQEAPSGAAGFIAFRGMGASAPIIIILEIPA